MAAFADNIDPASPAGSDLRSNGDDVIRKLARATLQRFQALVVDADDDAMALKAGAIKSTQLASVLQLRSVMRGTRLASGAIAAGLTFTSTAPLIGAAVGDQVVANIDGVVSVAAVELLIVRGYVSAADTVVIKVSNPTGSSITINDTITFAVIKAVLIP